MIYIGVDPGATGGIAVIDDLEDSVVVSVMPSTERSIYEVFEALGETASFAVIEKVGGYIAGNPAPGSAMFNFGVSYGGLRMALIACNIPFEEVVPRRWQKALGITPRDKGESHNNFKNRLKQKAQQLYPGGNGVRTKITLAVADALLIATYCQRWREGKL